MSQTRQLAAIMFADVMSYTAIMQNDEAKAMKLPGSIFVLAKVVDDIKNHTDIQTVSLGKFVLKNVAAPMEIFAVSNQGLQVPLNKKPEGNAQKYIDKASIQKIKKRFVGVLLIVSIGLCRSIAVASAS